MSVLLCVFQHEGLVAGHQQASWAQGGCCHQRHAGGTASAVREHLLFVIFELHSSTV
jgi:hypothetical protein